jgi:hypothetical protein
MQDTLPHFCNSLVITTQGNYKTLVSFRCVRKIAKSDYKLRCVCPSVRMEQLGSTGRIFIKFDIRVFFDVLTSIVSFIWAPSTRGGVAYGVRTLSTNRKSY